MTPCVCVYIYIYIYIHILTILDINFCLKIFIMLLTFSEKTNMSVGREWMYTRLNADSTINKDFVDEVESVVAYACK